MMPLRNSRVLSIFGSLLIVVVGIDGASSAEPEPIAGNSQHSDALPEGLVNHHEIVKNSEIIRRQSAALRARLERDTGICASKNFSVMCTAQELDSRDVLAKAESLRGQIATELLGAALTEGSEFALIHVQLSANVDEGLTMLMDRPEQGHHRVWLTTSKERALGSTLAHEIAHVVLRARFPKGMPAWANEGLASRYDDADRKATRRKMLASMSQDGGLPSVTKVLDLPRMAPTDEAAYTVAASMTEFLQSLSPGNQRKFVNFVEEGMRKGWDTALNSVYGIHNVSDLQQQWESWVSRRVATPRVASHRHGARKS